MCVHTRHCTYDSCKYGEEDFCPVYLGEQEPETKVTEMGLEIDKPSQGMFFERNRVAENNHPSFEDDIQEYNQSV